MAKKKVRRNVVKGIAHIAATFNNTIITITDMSGETLCWDSAGTVGFKGARKATPFAASRAAERCAGKAKRDGQNRGQAGIDFFREPGALLAQRGDLVGDIDIVVGTHQLQFLDLDFEVGNGLFKIQEVGIHGGVEA